MKYEAELEVAIDAAAKAAKVMQEYQKDGFSIDRKETYTDRVTAADIECQEIIVDHLSDHFPEDGFLAEEDGLTPEDEDRVWVIDPIDGTNNYTHGLPYYCTSIALRIDNTSMIGVVYSHVNDELFCAVRGEGAWLNGDPIQVSSVNELRDALVAARLTDTEKENGKLYEREERFMNELLATPSSFRHIGSAALDACYVACGRLDGQVLATINEWDIAAGRLIIEEAGGTFRQQDAIFDEYTEFIASNGELQDRLETVFDETVRADE